MATQYDPIAKDESLNTTELTPRNIADVLAEGLADVVTALGGGSLDDLSDVSITTPSDGQILVYDGNDSEWKNENAPTIPTVNDATLTLTQNGSTLGTFTANASSNVTIDVPGGGGGGGHTIIDPDGTSMTQRAGLAFIDAHVSDDAVNDETEIEIVEAISKTDWDNLDASDASNNGLYEIEMPNNTPILDASMVAYGNGTVDDALDGNANRRTRRNITTDLANLSTAVSEQNLARYGYSIGDYFTGASGYTYILADMNTHKGTNTPYCISANHITIFVNPHTQQAWNTNGLTSGGYNGSDLHSFLKGTVLTNIKSDLTALLGGWSTHLLAHTKLLTTDDANWSYQADQYIVAPSELEVFGSIVCGANFYQTGDSAKKLELFSKYKWTEVFDDGVMWLKDINTNGRACIASGEGYIANSYTGDDRYAVGLIEFK